MENHTDLNSLIVVVLGVGLIGKILFDWFKEGRIEKAAVYVKTEDFNKKLDGIMKTNECSKNRENCCVIDIKKSVNGLQNDSGKMELRIKSTEKMLEKGDQNFKEFRSEMAKTNIIMAGLAANMEALRSTMEHKIERIVIKDN